jgi:hypothetical protein
MVNEGDLERKSEHTAVWGVIAFLAGLIYLRIIWFISFEVIMPLILPADLCYYHTHDTPFLIDFFYMSLGSNGHPDGSLIHSLLIIVLSFFLGHLSVKKYRIYRAKN